MSDRADSVAESLDAEADRLWGPGNWVQCDCKREETGSAARHHKDFHGSKSP